MGGPPGLVFLIGFMGAGKTTVGRHLARFLGWDFVDLDEEIVRNEGRSIPEIFAGEGEAYFRLRETEILRSLRGRARLVVACGGGTYAHEECRRLIDGLGRAVWIQVPLEVALRRCAGLTGRPLLKDSAQAGALYRRRLPSYRAATLQVDSEGLSPEEVAARIAGLL
jgi:shikimate kinase